MNQCSHEWTPFINKVAYLWILNHNIVWFPIHLHNIEVPNAHVNLGVLISRSYNIFAESIWNISIIDNNYLWY